MVRDCYGADVQNRRLRLIPGCDEKNLEAEELAGEMMIASSSWRENDKRKTGAMTTYEN